MGTRWRFAMKKADKDIDNEGVRSPLKGSGGYGIWDITGYYRPTKGLTARAGAFNILDKKYITWGEAKGLADDISRERYSAPGDGSAPHCATTSEQQTKKTGDKRRFFYIRFYLSRCSMAWRHHLTYPLPFSAGKINEATTPAASTTSTTMSETSGEISRPWCIR